MPDHFRDAAYYLKRAGEHTKLGIEEQFRPVEARIAGLLGRRSEPDPEPQPSGIEAMTRRVRAIDSHPAIEGAKARVEERRERPPA
ncbi:DUF7553 family protein [Natronorarus salvus]|uniref:DUF7553 family protein n=1 Tax=Natronorarus salvus TaxID=3117733 RepID=UPI002F2616D6